MLWWRLHLIYTIWKLQLLWPNTGDWSLQSRDCCRPIVCTYSMHSYSCVQSQCWKCAAWEGSWIMSWSSFVTKNEGQTVFISCIRMCTNLYIMATECFLCDPAYCHEREGPVIAYLQQKSFIFWSSSGTINLLCVTYSVLHLICLL